MDPNEIDALLDSAKLPEATVQLCLRPDLREQWEKLDNELKDVQSAHVTMGGVGPREKELAKQIKDIEAQIAKHTLEVRLRGLAHDPWATLVASYPPRPDFRDDQAVGLNLTDFLRALIAKEIVEPELSREQLEKLLGKITDAQYNDLANAAWQLGRADRSGPVFSQAASRVIPDSDETSRPLSA